MRVAFFGSSAFSVPLLRSLSSQIAVVVTKKARPKGRGYVLDDNAVKKAALELSLPVREIDSFRGPESEALRSLDVDLFVVISFGLIIPRWLLDVPVLGAINVHPSLLPKYRGPSPMQWALLHGDEETGITVIGMTERMDAGPIVYQERTAVSGGEDGRMLSSRLSERSATVVLPLVAKIGQARRVDGLEQDEAAATYCPIITKEMGLIDWRQRAIDVVRKVRALVEWPTAYTYLEGKMLKIYGVEEVSAGGDEPGLVRGLSKGGFIVTTGSGTVVVTDVQIENRKRVSGRDFANGYRDLVGKTLGM